jgi:hypothetical protein
VAQKMLFMQKRGEVMLAVPIVGNEVAPRFNSATDFVIAEQEGIQAPVLSDLWLPDNGWSCRLQHLSALGVDILLCGGFNRRFLPFAASLGIQVHYGLTGSARELVAAFFQNGLDQFRLTPRGMKSESAVKGGCYR